MPVKPRHASRLVVTVLAIALLAWSYLWFRAAMRIPVLSRPAARAEAAVRPRNQEGPRDPGSACFDPTRRVDVPCPPSNPLVEAAQAGDVKLVESQLARRAGRKTLDEALFTAARSEPMVNDPSGKAVHEIDLQYARIARLLLKKGASLEARDRDGSTPLILAAGNGETAVVKLFLDKGADIEATDDYGQTPLIRAACDCPSIDMPDTDGSVRLLLTRGANIEARDREGSTALMAAAAWGRTWILQILLDNGAQIEARNSDGNTALIISAAGGGYPTAEAVQLLLARGAVIEARNDNGNTPLMLAASQGGSEDVEIVRMLLNKRANVRARNKQGHTALDLALSKRRTQIIPLLRVALAASSN
jgi:ankyrin repeat protein